MFSVKKSVRLGTATVKTGGKSLVLGIKIEVLFLKQLELSFNSTSPYPIPIIGHIEKLVKAFWKVLQNYIVNGADW